MKKYLFFFLGCLALYGKDLAVNSPEDFKALPAFFELQAAEEGTKILYNGVSPHSRDLFIKESYPLDAQKFIHVRAEFTKHTWDYSARFIPVLCFYGADGKLLSRLDMDYEYLCTPDFSTAWLLGERTFYHNDIRVPSGAKRLEICLNCRGNKFAFTLHKFSVSDQAKDQTKAIFKRPDFPHPEPALTREQAKELLAKRPVLNASTKQVNGRVVMDINGKTASPLVFKNGPVEGSLPEQLRRCATFEKAGFKIFVVNVPFGQNRGRKRGPVWTGPDSYNIAELENAVYDVIANVPDAYVMLELHVNPYYEWCLENPDEISCNAKGEKGLFTSRFLRYSNNPPKKGDTLVWQPSIHSEKFLADAGAALEEVFRRFSETPAARATVGVYLNGGIDNQWFSTPHNDLDHSKAAVTSFRNFLKKKYGTDEALQKAWAMENVTLENAALPTSAQFRYQGFTYTSAMVPDYNSNLRETGTALIGSMAAAVKRGSSNRLLAGAYWPNGGLSSYPMSEHANTWQLLNSKDFDFFATVPDYYISREPGQAHSVAAYNGSMFLHNKLLLNELDIRTGELRNWGAWGADFYMDTHNAETFRQDLFSFAAWSYALGGGFHAYDLTCGFWDTEKAISAWKEGMDMLKGLDDAPAPVAPVAVFTEEDTKHYYTQHPSFNTFQYGLRETPLKALALSGVKYNVYMPGDVFRQELADSRVLIFSDAGFMDKAAADKVRAVYGNKGRVIVWNYLPGIFTGSAPGEVCGFNLKRDASVDKLPLSILHSEHPLTAGLAGFNTDMSTLRAGEHYVVNDAVVLAVYRDTAKGAMAVKSYPEHTEVWIGQAGAFSPTFCRNLAKLAGVTPVIDTDEPVYISNGIIAMQAAFSGRKTLTLPENFGKYTVFTGQKPLSASDGKLVFQLKAGETLVIRK